MTTKHLSGRYPGGYTLAYGYSRLVIGRSGYIGGDGLTVPFSASVVNGGVVHGGRQGVFLEGGGSLVNGAAQNTRATITGQQDGVTAFYATAVANFGTIRSSGSNGAGVFVGDAASVTNGSAADSAALISGYYGVESNGGPATVVNFGTIEGAKYGVSIDNGGKVTNGSAADTRASIFGVAIGAADATVTNFGTIAGAATARCGVDLQTGGVVTNGSATDVAAIISGSSCGVYGYALTLANFGTIEAASSARSGAGLAASGRGSLTNGSAADTSALIQGYDGCDIGRLTTLTNNGTIEGAAHGVYLNAYSPSLINGSDQNRTALITGNVGLESWFSSQGRLVNYGTIRGSAWGVRLGASATLTNGSATDHTALIEAAAGFYARENFGYVTLDNFGIVEGTSGLAVGLSGGPNEVIAEAGSTFIGSVQGGGGRLALAGGGVGTISGLGEHATITGAVAADISGFGSYEIAAGGAWTLAGPNTLNSDDVLSDQGTLVNRGALTIAGTLSIGRGGVFRLAAGRISAGEVGAARIVDDGLMIKNPGSGVITVGAHMLDRGVVEVASGTLDFTSRLFGAGALKIDGGATLEADAGAVSTLTTRFDGGAATLALANPNTFAATLAGLAVGDVIDLLAVTATGASVDGGDRLVIVNGATTVASLQLSGNYFGATFTVASDGHGGANVALTSVGNVELPSVHRMAAAMAAMAATPAGALFARDLVMRHAPILTTLARLP